jgi:hypothetical protein
MYSVITLLVFPVRLNLSGQLISHGTVFFSHTENVFFLNDDCTFVLFVLCPWALQLEGAKMQGTQPKHFSLATCVSVLHFICQAYGCEIFLGRMPEWSGSRKERIDPILLKPRIDERS